MYGKARGGTPGFSRADEAGGDFLPTVVDEQTEVDGQVETDEPEDVGLEDGAKAKSGLEVGQPLN